MPEAPTLSLDEAIETLGGLVSRAGGEGDEALDVFKDLAGEVEQLRAELRLIHRRSGQALKA